MKSFAQNGFLLVRVIKRRRVYKNKHSIQRHSM